ncbi:protein spaetzle isoform X2 [Cotesia glomerata]|nr:protein spaetzle isoform X2 [Cotesia glomerata]
MKIFLMFIIYVLQQEIQAFPDSRASYNYEESSMGFNNFRSSNERHIRFTPESDKIIFPTEKPSEPEINYTPELAPGCYNSTFCEYVPNYPKEYVKHTIKNMEDLKYLSFVDESPEISQRIDLPEDDSLCTVDSTVIFPKSARNKQNEWLFIINENSFLQGVRIERCVAENTSCKLIEGFAEGYMTSCRQKFIYRQLAAITTNGTVGPDWFSFPSSCCCHVKFNGNPLQRIASARMSINNNNNN